MYMRDIFFTSFIQLFPIISQALETWHWNAITKMEMTVHTDTRAPIVRHTLLCKVFGESDHSKTTTEALVQHKAIA